MSRKAEEKSKLRNHKKKENEAVFKSGWVDEKFRLGDQKKKRMKPYSNQTKRRGSLDIT